MAVRRFMTYPVHVMSFDLRMPRPGFLCVAKVLLPVVILSSFLKVSASPVYYRPAESREPKVMECEVAVYGGTPAGVTAAVQAARMGHKAMLFSFNGHVGGMTSGGLTATDIGEKESIGRARPRFLLADWENQ